MTPNRLITIAIHTYDKALHVKAMLEAEGIDVELNNVNLAAPQVSAGVRVRIKESDLPLALRIVENPEIFAVDHVHVALSGGSILVPIDFTAHSKQAVEVALLLAARLGCEIVLLHAYISPMAGEVRQLSDAYDYEVADMREAGKLARAARITMDNYLAAVRTGIKKGKYPAVKCHSVIVEGVPEEAILEYIRQKKPALLVMGTRAKDRKEAELVGSVTAEVLDGCRIPAITIPENVDVMSFIDHLLPGDVDRKRATKVAFFCNLDQEDLLAMDALYRMFPDIHLHVNLLHMPVRRWRYITMDDKSKLDPDKIIHYCKELYKGYDFSFHALFQKDILGELKNILSGDCSLICCANKYKHAVRRVFNPGMAHKVLFMADVPMLVIPV